MIGFIGVGNMATAMIRGMISSGIASESIYVFDVHQNKLSYMEKNMKVNSCKDSVELVQKCKYIFLAIKPHVYDSVLQEIKEFISDDKVIITMAPGYEISKVKQILGDKKVVRTMPNTPALVGEGLTVICFDDLISEEEKSRVVELINAFGQVRVIDEHYVNAYSAISGSGPAFVFVLIEAMADAAVLLGIPRGDAYKAVEQTILGSAKLALETEKHPAELKDMVCSPAGTTIEGIRTLEEKGFRSLMIESIINTYKKNINIKNIR